MKIAYCLMTIGMAFCTSAFADKLPGGAKQLTESEVIALYAGNSMVWDKDNVAFFAPDGTVVSTFRFGDNRGYTLGSWKVTGSELCKNTAEWFNVAQKTNGKGTPDCWRWAKKGKTYFTLQTVRFDGSKPDKNAWNKGENKNFKNGDHAGKKIDAMKSEK